ncbi:hypothetical protein CTI12_AA011040 [Artemisia annua]|uniref:Uncharacterized protein n=1 Tax=Artemisia annua TaxID=35608 RepID=A0A2U1QMF0_ARTAN|nr:hypothetical protein CTI12_AA011040 [Artemisia annua]
MTCADVSSLTGAVSLITSSGLTAVASTFISSVFACSSCTSTNSASSYSMYRTFCECVN